jgi:hypothetical protein
MPDDTARRGTDSSTTEDFERKTGASVFPSPPVEPVNLGTLLGVPGPLMTSPPPDPGPETPAAAPAPQAAPGDSTPTAAED